MVNRIGVGNRQKGELSEWGVVKMGNRRMGNCLVVNHVSGELSEWGIVGRTIDRGMLSGGQLSPNHDVVALT
jgi:hypothetical protein